MAPSRYPGAEWRPGPEWKQGYDFFGGRVNHNLGKGVAGHSAEGSYQGCLAVLDGPRQASWTLTFRKVGPPVQHYDLNAITWHCGRYGDAGGQVAGNGCLLGVECEGKAGEPLTQNQVNELTAFLKWYWKVHELGEPSRPDKEQTFPYLPIPRILDDELWEHNEISSTDCPSGRIPWQTLIEGMTMASQTEEWAIYQKGLEAEYQYIDRVLAEAEELARLKARLTVRWRPGPHYPVLDGETFKLIGGLCLRMKAASNDLYGRCVIQGRDK